MPATQESGFEERTGAGQNQAQSTGDGHPLTDTGNAERLLRWFGKDLKYCPDWDAWLVWDGTRWRKDEERYIFELSKRVSRKIKQAAGSIEREEDRDKWIGWAHKSQSLYCINAMIILAKSDPRIVARSEAFNKDLCMFNCATGTVDLRTGNVTAHRREDLLTKLSPVKLDPTMTPEKWLKFLDLITARNESLISYLQRCIGYSLTGRTDEKVVFISHGSGNNGKTVFHRVLLSLFGDYGMATAPETIMEKKIGGGIPNDVAKLTGARFVLTAETNEGSYINEGLIKRVTGGDPISARFMRGEFFDFIPQFALWMETNHKPQIRGSDPAIWNRLKLIPFIVDIVNTLPAKELKKRDQAIAELESELPGILHWAVCGAVQWFSGGLREPEKVTKACTEYRNEQDIIGEFLEGRCERLGKVRTTDLYAAYCEWCAYNNERPISRKCFKDKLHDQGIDKYKSDGDWYYKGIELKANLKSRVKFSGLPNDQQQVLNTDCVMSPKVM